MDGIAGGISKCRRVGGKRWTGLLCLGVGFGNKKVKEIQFFKTVSHFRMRDEEQVKVLKEPDEIDPELAVCSRRAMLPAETRCHVRETRSKHEPSRTHFLVLA